MKSSKRSSTPPQADTDEWWVPMQVAAHMNIAYQDARNAMLEGRFGSSEYDAKTRRLTVRAQLVRDAKSQRDARKTARKKSRKRTRS